MMYAIEFSEGALEDLMALRAFEQSRILDAIEEQLSNEPTIETRNRKLLSGLIPPFEATPPVWELRVAQYRVFYDVSEEERKVFIRAVSHKPPHRRTEEIV